MGNKKLTDFNVKNAGVETVTNFIVELFEKYDLNDDESKIFKVCIERIKDYKKSCDKELKQLKMDYNKINKAKENYKKEYFSILERHLEQ